MTNKRPIEDDERNCVIMAGEMLGCDVADVPPLLKQRLANIDDAVWAYHDKKGEVGSSQVVAMMIEIEKLHAAIVALEGTENAVEILKARRAKRENEVSP